MSGGGSEEDGGKEGRMRAGWQPTKLEPHTEMWGTNLKLAHHQQTFFLRNRGDPTAVPVNGWARLCDEWQLRECRSRIIVSSRSSAIWGTKWL